MSSRSLFNIVSILLLVSSIIDVEASSSTPLTKLQQRSNRNLGIGYAESSYYNDGKGKSSKVYSGEKEKKSKGKGGKSNGKGVKYNGKHIVQSRHEYSSGAPSPVQDTQAQGTDVELPFSFPSPSDTSSGQSTNTPAIGDSTSGSFQGRIDEPKENELNNTAENSQTIIGISTGESSVQIENSGEGELTDSTGIEESGVSEEFQNVFNNINVDGVTSIEVEDNNNDGKSNGGRPFLGTENEGTEGGSSTGGGVLIGEGDDIDAPSEGNVNIGTTEGNSSQDPDRSETNAANEFSSIAIGSSEGFESNEENGVINVVNEGTVGAQSPDGSEGITLEANEFLDGAGNFISGSQGSNASGSSGASQGASGESGLPDGAGNFISGSQGSNASGSSEASQGVSGESGLPDGAGNFISGSQGSNASGSSEASQGVSGESGLPEGTGDIIPGSQGSNVSGTSEGSQSTSDGSELTGDFIPGSQGSNVSGSSEGSQGAVTNTDSMNGSSGGTIGAASGSFESETTPSGGNQSISPSVNPPNGSETSAGSLGESFETEGVDGAGTNEGTLSERNENEIGNNHDDSDGNNIINIVNNEGEISQDKETGTGGGGSLEGSTNGDSFNVNQSPGQGGSNLSGEEEGAVKKDDFASDPSTAVFCPDVSSDTEVLINWIYAVEFLPDLTNEEKAQAVAIMELKLVSELLECTLSALPGKRTVRHRNLLEDGIAGLNYMPLDAKNDDVVCFFSNSTDGGVCETYFGRMEMYLQDDYDENIAINDMLISIRNTMQRSDFPSVDGIVQVWYLDPELGDIDGISSGGVITNDPEQPADSFSTGTMIAFAALGVFVFAALVLGAFRMRRNENEGITVFDQSTVMGSAMTAGNDSATFLAILPNSYKLDNASGMDAIPEADDDSDSRQNCSIILSDGGYTSDGDSQNDPLYPAHFYPVLGEKEMDEDDMEADNDLLYENTQSISQIKCMGEGSLSNHRKTNLVRASQMDLGRRHSTVDVHKCSSARCTICNYKPKDVEFIHKSPNSPAVSAGRFFPEDEYSGDEII